MDDITSLELRSTVQADGTLRLQLEEVVLTPPSSDEVIVRVEAAPINPSDLGLLLGPADLSSMVRDESGGRSATVLTIPADRMGGLRARLGQSLPVGNEGAGMVIAAGDGAGNLLGKRVGLIGGGMYTQFRKLPMRSVAELPDGATAVDGAAMFVNPLTALAFVETMRGEGHTAIVHTAAASNLGQMLQKICLADGVALVNIVRSAEQAAILMGIGATHVLDSTDADFRERLVDTIAETGATLAFDAIGGGTLGGTIVGAMEQAASRGATEYSRYGSTTFKQLYIYGALDVSPTVLNRMGFGFGWSVGGFLLTPFLQGLSAERNAALRQRVRDELTTTFASHYTRTIGLAQALEPEVIRAFDRKATGEKYLIDPTR